MNVSPLTLTDCAEAARLHQEAFFKGWSETTLQESLQNSLTFGLKTEDGNTLSGYILWREVVDEAEILALIVAPSSKRKGIGSLLLKTLFVILKDKAVPKLSLEVAEDSTEAASFYRKHGFVCLSKRPHYYPREEGRFICALNFTKKIG